MIDQKIFEKWEIQYLNAFYFVINSIAKVGYSDILPMNSCEKIYVMILNTFGLLIFGYYIC